jgi:hypothetical protein
MNELNNIVEFLQISGFEVAVDKNTKILAQKGHYRFEGTLKKKDDKINLLKNLIFNKDYSESFLIDEFGLESFYKMITDGDIFQTREGFYQRI